jgi:hypothetical protein
MSGALVRRADFLETALVGVAACPKCKSVGTIVDMKKCCLVAKLVALGPLWDVPARARRTRPHGPRVAHG